VSAVVDANGDVRPCFFHAPVGNLAKGLAATVNGPAAVAFREALDVATNATCRQCVCSLYV
jgi:radical SAM protein with 4Fe4S-binding SPASM domain